MDWRRKTARNIGAGNWLMVWDKIPMKITGIEYPRDGTITFTLRAPAWPGLTANIKQKFGENQRPLTAREDD